MAARRPVQAGLFGGDEEVGEEAPPGAEPQARGTDEERWLYPPGAFPPDPWDALHSRTVRELGDALDLASPEAVRGALCRYFKRGLASSFDHGELVDLLCVSNDLLGEAGFSSAEVDRVLSDVLPTITDREIRSTPLD